MSKTLPTPTRVGVEWRDAVPTSGLWRELHLYKPKHKLRTVCQPAHPHWCECIREFQCPDGGGAALAPHPHWLLRVLRVHLADVGDISQLAHTHWPASVCSVHLAVRLKSVVLPNSLKHIIFGEDAFWARKASLLALSSPCWRGRFRLCRCFDWFGALVFWRMVVLAARVPLMTSLLELVLVGAVQWLKVGNYSRPGYLLFAEDSYQKTTITSLSCGSFRCAFSLFYSQPLSIHPYRLLRQTGTSAKFVHGKRLKIEVLNSFCVRSMTKSTSSGFSPYTTLYSGFLAYKAAFGYLTLGGVGLCNLGLGPVCVSMRRAGSNGPWHCSED
jgi:hypothetical protein